MTKKLNRSFWFLDLKFRANPFRNCWSVSISADERHYMLAQIYANVSYLFYIVCVFIVVREKNKQINLRWNSESSFVNSITPHSKCSVKSFESDWLLKFWQFQWWLVYPFNTLNIYYLPGSLRSIEPILFPGAVSPNVFNWSMNLSRFLIK